MLSTRQRAAALLDVLCVRDAGDRPAESVRMATAYRAALASKLYPTDALLWAWADAPADREHPQPGELDRRRFCVEQINGKDVRVRTAFGVLFGWFGSHSMPRGSMVLAGGAGTGKNVAAAYAAVHRGGVFYPAPRIGELKLSGSEELDRLHRADLVVLDELGRESAIGKTRERIVALVQQRHDDRLATLLTTNIASRIEFGKAYGEHVLDRIDSSGGYRELVGSSRRRKGVEPLLTAIHRDCRIADLVAEVDALTSAIRFGGSSRPIALLAEEFGVAEPEIEAAAERRAAAMRVPDGIDLGPLLDGVLRRAAGEADDGRRERGDIVCVGKEPSDA